jgi:IS30 family transposase
MSAQYARLTDEERDTIARWLAAGWPQADIARELGRRPSTISREVKRNGYRRGGYGAAYAGWLARRRRQSCREGKYKLESNERLWNYVRARLHQLWSPQQIATGIRKEYPLDIDMRISPEAIYQYLYVQPSKELRRLLRPRPSAAT